MEPRFPTVTATALLVLLLGWASPAPAQQGQRAEISKAVLNVSGLKPGEKAAAAVVLDIFPGYHAQSRTPSQDFYIKFDAKLDANPAVTFGDVIYPQGHDETYPDLGKLNVYVGRIVIKVPVQVKPDAPPGPVKITGTLKYQICDDKVCFPPESSKFAIETKVVGKDEKVEAVEEELFKAEAPERGNADGAATTAPSTLPASSGGGGSGGMMLKGLEGSDWSVMYALGAAFVAGLLFNVMPCVLPVLPLKASGFYEAAQHSRARSVQLGLVFSAGLVSVFGVLALFILVFKSFTWGALFSKGWFIWTIVALLVAMAFGLFGAFTFRLPMGAYSFEPRHDTVSGNFLLGALTAILATPCTAPLLPPLLLWASAQPVWLGMPAFLMVGVGMAFPYLILSATPELARRFPRTGPWSELFKQMMGFMMLAAAAYFAGGRLVQGTGFWWIVVATVAVAALFLVARTVQLSPNALPVAVSSVLAIAMLGGVLWWTAQITGLGSPAYAAGGDVKTQWVPYSKEKFEALRKEGKPILVKFTANWCATCQVVEGTVFKNPAVWDSLAKHDVVAMKVDLTEEGAPGNDLLLQLNPGGGIPLTAVFSPTLPQPILIASIYKSETLLSAIDKATNGPAVAAK